MVQNRLIIFPKLDMFCKAKAQLFHCTGIVDYELYSFVNFVIDAFDLIVHELDETGEKMAIRYSLRL
jgi:hypothetical protein